MDNINTSIYLTNTILGVVLEAKKVSFWQLKSVTSVVKHMGKSLYGLSHLFPWVSSFSEEK
jgi:hypothetical protein